MYENRADHLNNNLRLNEISILIFSQFYSKINRKQSEIVIEATHGLHAYQYFAIYKIPKKAGDEAFQVSFELPGHG